MDLPIGMEEGLRAMDALQGRGSKGFSGTLNVVVGIDPVRDGKSLDFKQRELRFQNGVLTDVGDFVGTQINLHDWSPDQS